MDESVKSEIDAIVKQHGIAIEDVQTDLDTRENYPGEFYLLSLMHIGTGDLRRWLELAWAEATP